MPTAVDRPDGLSWDTVDPESVLPVQFAKAAARTPEQGLLLAILEDALRCAASRPSYTQYGASISSAVEAAREWIGGREGRFAFREVCEHLGLDPDAVRRSFVGVVPARKPSRFAGMKAGRRVQLRRYRAHHRQAGA